MPLKKRPDNFNPYKRETMLHLLHRHTEVPEGVYAPKKSPIFLGLLSKTEFAVESEIKELQVGNFNLTSVIPDMTGNLVMVTGGQEFKTLTAQQFFINVHKQNISEPILKVKKKEGPLVWPATSSSPSLLSLQGMDNILGDYKLSEYMDKTTAQEYVALHELSHLLFLSKERYSLHLPTEKSYTNAPIGWRQREVLADSFACLSHGLIYGEDTITEKTIEWRELHKENYPLHDTGDYLAKLPEYLEEKYSQDFYTRAKKENWPKEKIVLRSLRIAHQFLYENRKEIERVRFEKWVNSLPDFWEGLD